MLLIAGLSSSCKKKCAIDDNVECPQDAYLTLDEKKCQCVCFNGGYTEYISAIDGFKICVPPYTQGLGEYEAYILDYAPSSIDICPVRRIFFVNLTFDLIMNNNSDALLDYPFQGLMEYYGIPNPNNAGYISGGEAFYMKKNKRDTLYFDKLIDFWPFNYYWPCGNGTKGITPKFSGFAVRNDTSLNWVVNVYHFGKDNFDIVNGVDPDTTVHFFMSRVF